MRGLKIAQVYGKGLDGCGVTKVGTEIQQWSKRNDIRCDVYSFDLKTYVRGASHDIETKSFKTIEEMRNIQDKLEDYDIIFYQSYPTNKFPNSLVNEFYNRIIRSPQKPIKVAFMHEITKMNTDKIPYLLGIMNESDFIYTFNTETWFAKSILKLFPSKVIDERMNKFTMFLDFEQFKPYREKSLKNLKNKDMSLRYVGRWTTMKDPARLFHLYPLMKDLNIKLELFGIERSIGAKCDIFDRELCVDHTKSKEDYEQMKEYMNGLRDFDIADGVRVFGPYMYKDAMELLTNTMFGCSFYNHRTHQEPYGDRMEYTQIEIIGAGAVPIFDTHWGENNKTKSGKRYIDIPYSAIYSDKDNLPDTVKQIKEVMSNAKLQKKYIETSYEIASNEFDVNIILPDMLKHIMKHNKDKKKFSNDIELVEKICKNKTMTKKFQDILKNHDLLPVMGIRELENGILAYRDEKNEIEIGKYEKQTSKDLRSLFKK